MRAASALILLLGFAVSARAQTGPYLTLAPADVSASALDGAKITLIPKNATFFSAGSSGTADDGGAKSARIRGYVHSDDLADDNGIAYIPDTAVRLSATGLGLITLSGAPAGLTIASGRLLAKQASGHGVDSGAIGHRSIEITLAYAGSGVSGASTVAVTADVKLLRPGSPSTETTTSTGNLSANFTISAAGDGVAVSASSLALVESGAEQSYTVKLNSDPAAMVTVVATSSNPAVEIKPSSGSSWGSSATLTFTGGGGDASNWNVAQTIDVRAPSDSDTASETGITITHAATVSTDNSNPYHNISISSVGVRVRDASAGVTASTSSMAIVESNPDQTYTLRLATDPCCSASVKVAATSSDDSALRVSSDGTTFAQTATLTFTGGSGGTWAEPQTITVRARNNDPDQVDEPGIMITHAVTVSGDTDNAYHAIPAPSVTVDVADKTGRPTVKLGQSSAFGFEAGPVGATLTVNKTGSGQAEVAYATQDLTTATAATAGADYTATSGTLSFGANETEKTFTVPILDDAVYDPNENFRVLLSAVPGSSHPTLLGNPRTAAVIINDDESPPSTLTLTATSSLKEGEGGRVTATLSQDVTTTVTIPVRIKSGQGELGLGGNERASTAATITILNGRTGYRDIVALVDDAAEGDETVVLEAYNLPSAITLAQPSDGEASVTVTNRPSVSFSISGQSSSVIGALLTLAEGATAQATATVSEAAPSGGLAVSFLAASGSTGSSTDYSLGSITIPQGQKSATGMFAATDDILNEGAETIVVRIDRAKIPTAFVARNYPTTVTITDNDAAPTDVSLSLSWNTIGESAAGRTVAKPTLTATVEGATRFGAAKKVRVSVAGSGKAGVVGFKPIAAFDVEIPAGAQKGMKKLLIEPVDDDEVNGDETLTFTGALANVAVAPATITLANDDEPGNELTPLEIYEGERLTFAYEPTASSRATDFHIAYNNTSIPEYGVDAQMYLVGGNTATAQKDIGAGLKAPYETIAVSDGVVQFDLEALADNTAEADEEIRIGVYSTGGPNIFAYPAGEFDVVLKDGPRPGEAKVSATALSIVESHPDQTYTLQLAADPVDNVQVVATSSDASAVTVSSDGTTFAQTATLTFTGGNSGNWGAAQTITVRTPSNDGDDADEPGVMITHAMTVPTNTSNLYHGASGPAVTVNVTDKTGLPSVRFSQSSFAVHENKSPITLTVNKTGAGAAEVAYATSDYTATAGADYTATSGTLSFGVSETSKTFTVTILDDDIYDPTESFRALLSVVPGSSHPTVLDNPRNVALIITDNESPPSTLTLSVNKSSVREGESATVTATLSQKPLDSVTIPVRIKTGASDASFSTEGVAKSEATIVINPLRGASHSRAIYARPDNLVESAETIVVEAYNLPSTVTLAQPGDGDDSFTVTNRPSVSFSISGQNPSAIGSLLTLAEGATAEVTASVSEAAPSGGLPVHLVAGGLSTGSSADYSLGSITIPQGAKSATGTFAATDDILHEGNETIVVQIDKSKIPDAFTVAGLQVTTVTITDDDAAPTTMALSVRPTTVSEDDGATAVTVKATVGGSTRFGAADTVEVSVAGSGSAGVVGFAAVEDFDLIIPAAADSGKATFTLTPTNDNTDQRDETITVSGVSGDVTIASATLTLADDDVSIIPTISLSGGSAVLETAADPQASFTLTASPAPTQALGVTVTIDDAAGDFLTSSHEGSRTVTIPANQGSHTFTVPVTNSDAADEPSGHITATVSQGDGYTVGTPSSGEVLVEDGSATPVVLAGAAGNVAEGNAKAFTVTLGRGLVKGEKITASLSLGGAATRGTDYTLAGAMATGVTYAGLASSAPKVIFTGPNTGASATTATLTLSATADAVAESTAETVTIGLGAVTHNLGPSGVTKTDNLASFSIEDLTVTISAGSAVVEGAAAAFTIAASAAVSSNLSVKVTIEDAPASDFVAAANEGTKTVTISAGQRMAQHAVATTSDNADEPDGKVKATVGSSTGYVVGSASVAEVAVSDNDATTVTIAGSAGNVTEGGAKTLTVTLGRGLVKGEKITAPLAFAGAASRGADYTLAGMTAAGVAYASLNSGAAQVVFTGPATGMTATAATLTLSALADNASEGAETADIGLGALVATGLGGGATATDNLAAFSITDPAAEPTITIGAGSAVAEGTAASFTLTANPAPAQALDVDVTVADAPSSNFIASSDETTHTVTIGASSATKTFTIATTADNTDEANGEVSAEVETGSGYAVGSPSLAAASVMDNDATTVTLATPDKAAKEGDATATAEATLTLGRALTKGEALAAPLIFAGGTAGEEFTLALKGSPAGVTFASATSTVTFAGGSTPSAASATLTLTAGDDTDTDDETVTVSIPSSSTGAAPVLAATGLGGGATGSRAGDGVIAIEDDDVIPEITIASDGGVTEGSSASFTLTATPAATQTTSVTVRVSDAPSSDFIAAADEKAHTVTLAAGTGAQTFSVATTADAVDEPNGAVAAEVEAGDGYTVGAANEAEAAVADNDATTLVLAGAAGNVTEGGAKTLTLTLGRALVANEKITAPITFAGGATRGTDYALAAPPTPPTGVAYENLSAGAAQVVFTGPSALAAPFTFTATADALAETPPETVTIGLGAIAAAGLGGGVAETNNLAAFAIEDPGSEPTITISEGSAVVEGSPASFTLNANPAPASNLAVTVRVDDAAGSDFVAQGGEGTRTVSIGANASSATFAVVTNPDADDEPNGPVTAEVIDAAGYAVGSPSSAEVAVSDDDATTVTLATPDKTATEGDAAQTAELTLTISRALVDGEALGAPLQFTGGSPPTHFTLARKGSEAGVAFDAATSTVTFAGGAAPSATAATLTLTAADDADAADRTVTVGIPASSAGGGATLMATNLGGGATGGRTGDGVITLVDSDEAKASFRVAAATAPEGAGAVNVAIDLDPAPPTVTVTPVDDTDARDETVAITHRATGYGGGQTVTLPTVTVGVRDDEGQQTAGVSASPLTLALTEGGGADAYALVLRTNPGGAVTVTPRSDDAGAATVTGALTFGGADWQTSQNVTVAPVDDTDARDETVTITHTATGYGGAATPRVTVTIADDDEPTPQASFASAALSVSEAAGTVAVTINLDPAPPLDVTLAYALAGDAALGDDYAISGVSTSAGALVVAGGSATADIDVSIADDSESEASETLVLTLQGGAGYDVGNPSVHTLAITDNDTPGVTATPDAITIEEGGSDGSYAIRLATNPGAQVTVTPLSNNEQAATVSGALTFSSANWQSPQTVLVTPVSDANTSNETVTITHAVTGYAGVTAGPVVTVTVLDDTGVVSVEREDEGRRGKTDEAEEEEIPTAFALEQNYPNPFNPTTTIEYALNRTERVTLVVYDILGRKVRTLVDGVQTAARHRAAFNASDLASGTYIYVLKTDERRAVKTMMLVK